MPLDQFSSKWRSWTPTSPSGCVPGCAAPCCAELCCLRYDVVRGAETCAAACCALLCWTCAVLWKQGCPNNSLRFIVIWTDCPPRIAAIQAHGGNGGKGQVGGDGAGTLANLGKNGEPGVAACCRHLSHVMRHYAAGTSDAIMAAQQPCTSTHLLLAQSCLAGAVVFKNAHS